MSSYQREVLVCVIGWCLCSGVVLRFIEVCALAKLFAESGIHKANLVIFCVV